jgi:hypothetical protein
MLGRWYHIGHMHMIICKMKLFTTNAQDWDEVLQRRANPDLTRFRAMSMDEHVEMINQTIEEFIQAQNSKEIEEQATRRDEGERLLVEVERRIHENEQNMVIEGLEQPRGTEKKQI